jgi:hypothetical protein
MPTWRISCALSRRGKQVRGGGGGSPYPDINKLYRESPLALVSGAKMNK